MRCTGSRDGSKGNGSTRGSGRGRVVVVELVNWFIMWTDIL